MSRTSQMNERITVRQELEKQERVDSILAAARKVFSDKGYLSATMRDIAFEAALSPGLIYHYYQGKDELYGAICEEAFHILLDYCHKAEQVEGTGWFRLVALAKAYVQYYKDYPQYFDIISFRDLGFKKVNISLPILQRIDKLSVESLDAVRKGAIECMAEGSIRHTDDLWGLTMCLWAAVEGIIFIDKRGYLGKFQLDLDHVVDEILKNLLCGLRT